MQENDTRIENEVIYALMNDENAYDRCVEYLKPGEKLFTDIRNAAIYRAIITMKLSGEHVDLLTVTRQLQKTGDYDYATKDGHLASVINGFISSANADRYVKILHEDYTRRSLLKVAEYITKKAGEGESVNKIAETVINQMHGALSGVSNIKYHQLNEINREVLREYQERAVNGGISGISTGIDRLDELTGGWMPNDLIVIGARPGVGKTNIALKFLMESARENTSLFISIEMAKERIAQRAMAVRSGVGDAGFRTCTLTDHQVNQVIDAAEAMRSQEGKNLFICDEPKITIAEVEVLIRRAVRELKIKMVAIDYLQLVSAENKRTREREIADISIRLKAAAKENKIPVIALAQINRDQAKDGDKPPKKHQLRESGQIEQDADLVILLHRFNEGKPGTIPEGYAHFSGMPSDGMMLVDLAKQRGGAEGWFFVNYHRVTGRITSIETKHNDNQSVDTTATPF